MPLLIRSRSCLLAALILPGCGGHAGIGSAPLPISVSLAVSTLSVTQGGTQAVVGINIVSTSETGTVSVTGLPSGVKESYASSDTNPSGSLMFTANTSAPLGTYMPTVTVISAGQTASTVFTLIVTAPMHAQ